MGRVQMRGGRRSRHLTQNPNRNLYRNPNRNKPPPERPETNNPKPPKFSGQLLRIRDLNDPKHCENRAKVGGMRLPNHATHTTTHPKGEQHAPTRPPDAPQLALVRVPPTTYPLAVRARLPDPLLVVV